MKLIKGFRITVGQEDLSKASPKKIGETSSGYDVHVHLHEGHSFSQSYKKWDAKNHKDAERLNKKQAHKAHEAEEKEESKSKKKQCRAVNNYHKHMALAYSKIDSSLDEADKHAVQASRYLKDGPTAYKQAPLPEGYKSKK